MKAIKLSSLILSFIFFSYGVFVNAQDQPQQKCKVRINIKEDGKEIVDTNFTLNQECDSREIEEIISEITGNKVSFIIESDSLTNWNIISADDSSKTVTIIKMTDVEADLDCKEHEEGKDKEIKKKIVTIEYTKEHDQ